MKRCVLIYNPNSGKNKYNKNKNYNRYLNLFKKYNYDVEIIYTKYQHHAKEIIVSLDNDVDLVLSIGGDGTFNEIVAGNLKREKPLVVSHVPIGTTNDIGIMFGLGKNIYKNIESILSGNVRDIDICAINDQPFVYVAGFGRFLNIAYETPSKLKKKFGYIAYLMEALKDFLKYATHLYDVTIEVDGVKHNGLVSFLLISNANRIAGIKNFYKDVKLDDDKFEVLVCNLKTKKDIMRSLLYLKTNDITKVSGFSFYKANHLKITFNEKLRRPWCYDGERLESKEQIYDVKIIPNVKMLLPKSISKELFVNGKN